MEGVIMATVKVTRHKESIGDRKDKENGRAATIKEQAFLDYNVMMGNLEDPEEDENERA